MRCGACNCKCQKFGKHRNGLSRFRCPRCKKTYTEEHSRLFGAMTVPEDKALLAIQLLLEGTSVRSAERISGIHRDTILRLLVVAGERCVELMESRMRNLRCKHLQADELWGFIGKKQRRVREDDPEELGDAWTFIALDADSKLIPAFMIGKRTRETTYAFLANLRNRMAEDYRFQLTTDGFAPYERGVEEVFAGQVDFAQVIKVYQDQGQRDAAGRYSPAPMVETIIKIRDGRPDIAHISTSYVERVNLTMRMSLRRLTRLTTGYSKKLDNFKSACALQIAYYNFSRIHASLRVSPAMEAGLTDHIWSLRELLSSHSTQH
jgi:transposase-like protein/IS1 family transposase